MLPVVVAAVGARRDELSLQICFDRCVRIALCAGDDLNAGLCQRVLRAAAEPAADQDIDRAVRKKSRQCAMPESVRTDHLTGDDLSTLNIIDLKSLCSSEMLENTAIIVSNCNLHF